MLSGKTRFVVLGSLSFATLRLGFSWLLFYFIVLCASICFSVNGVYATEASDLQDGLQMSKVVSQEKLNSGLADSPWPCFGHDVRNTGRSEYEGINVPVKMWSYAFTLYEVQNLTSPVIGNDGTIYVGAGDKLHAINKNGTQKWTFSKSVDSPPCIGRDGTIYLSSYSKLYAVISNGTQKWYHGFGINNDVVGSPVISNDETIYVCIYNGLNAINLNSTKKWTFETDDQIKTSPVIGVDNNVYFGSFNGFLYSVNKDGTINWIIDSLGSVVSTPAISKNGTIYVGSQDNCLYAINTNGTIKWSFKTEDDIETSTAIGKNGNIFIESYDEKIYAITPDGKMTWSYEVGHSCSPVIDNNGVIYTSTSRNSYNLYAINSDGTKKWLFKTEEDIVNSPVIGKNKVIYVSSHDKLYALGVPKGESGCYGIISDISTGQPVKNVTVFSGQREVKTDINGGYSIDLEPGTYDITYTKSDYETLTINDVVVEDGEWIQISKKMTTPGPLNITTTSFPAAEVGVEYNQRMQISGGAYGYTFSVASGTLPSGLSLDSDEGTVSGTPTEAGSYTFFLRVEDAEGAYAERQFSIGVTSPLQFKTEKDIQRGVINHNYHTLIEAEGGKKPYNYQIVDGELPINLLLTPDGEIKGEITNIITFDKDKLHQNWTTENSHIDNSHDRLFVRAGTYIDGSAEISVNCKRNGYVSFNYENDLVCDYGYCGSSKFYIDEEEIEWWPRDDANGYYSYHVNGGEHTFKWYLRESGEGGLDSGTQFFYIDNLNMPVKYADLYEFTVKVTDDSGRTELKEFKMYLDDELMIDTENLDVGVLGSSYNKQLSAQGGQGDYTWDVFSGMLPEGLAIDNESGIISGKPQEATYDTIVLSVKDEYGRIDYQDFTLQVVEPLQIPTDSLPDGLIDEFYSEAVQTQGGAGPYSFSYQGQLPAGLSLDEDTGIISGTPTSAGVVNVEFTVTDSTYPTNQSATQTMSIRTSSDLTILTSAGLANAKEGEEINPIVLEAGGGPSPYTWQTVGGTMPPGISLDSQSGELSGTPMDSGDYMFTIQVTDAEDPEEETASKEFFWHVSGNLSIATGAIPDGGKDEEYSFSLEADGGLPPYDWRIKSGTMPDGLSFDQDTGTIHGTPTTRQSYSFTVEVNDSDSPAQTAEASYVIEILDELYIATKSLANGRVDEAYTQNISAGLGEPPYSWSLASGVLPDGLELTSTSEGATLEGTPTEPGSYTFTIQVQDSGTPVQTATREFMVDIFGPLSFVIDGLKSAYNGQPYSDTIEVAGGTPPYTWQITAGSLPTGLTLDHSSGHISGTTNLNAGQSSTFTVKVTDSGDPSGFVEEEFTLYVIDPLKITTQDIQNAMQGLYYQASLEGQGGVSPYTWSISSGELPQGLELNADSGVISGTPEEFGDFSFTVRLEDSAAEPNVDTRSYALEVLKNDDPEPESNATLPGVMMLLLEE